MASRVAVIATRVGGIPEILGMDESGCGIPAADSKKNSEVPIKDLRQGCSGHAGQLIPPRDAEAMAAAILELAENKAERDRLAQAGFEAAHRNHDPVKWVKAIEAVYQDTLTQE